MKWEYDDGGRADAGFKGYTGDCVVRAISIATRLPYQSVYDTVNVLAQDEKPSRRRKARSSARTGVHRITYQRFLEDLGWLWVPTMKIGTGCQIHLDAGELPSGRLIVRVSKHMCAVINGVVRDTADPSRDGTRCVYGYFMNPEEQS